MQGDASLSSTCVDDHEERHGAHPIFQELKFQESRFQFLALVMCRSVRQILHPILAMSTQL